jgi:hypothetical protein
LRLLVHTASGQSPVFDRSASARGEEIVMNSSFLEPAFAHHVWATLRVIDACLDLSAEELETNVPGTRGPMLETLRHVVGGTRTTCLS